MQLPCMDVSIARHVNLLYLHSTPTALGRIANILFAILERTLKSGRRELELVASQDDIANPPTTYKVTQLR